MSFLQRWSKPLIALIMAGAAVWLVYRLTEQYDFAEVWQAVRAMPMQRLLTAGGFAALSYLCLTGFDAIGLHYAGKPLSHLRVALASFTTHAIGHTIGLAILSSGAIRYRFYSRWGLNAEQVAKVILCCGVTVGLGLTGLISLSLLIKPDLAETIVGLSSAWVRVIGAVGLALLVIYPLLAAKLRRPLKLWRWSFGFPTVKVAVAQVLLGPLNFACVAACLHQLLLAVVEIDYPSAAAAYGMANVAGLVSHVPGGMGVIEAVLVTILPGAKVLAAAVTFRALYYLAPLPLGVLAFLLAEVFASPKRSER
ncbi:lysylphosphatidylglycerol synthase domain-containing protein [Lacibacterium aquatile]|uniref:Lysylphosphatidylglycerol synthase domain-containing protein n=1 Tax=Lacibacterium aquatile TaxID=1168082 RepID=A0ABW5DYG7_9PROT